MSKDITIPPEAVRAAAYQVCKGAGDDFVCKVMCDGCKDVARQALIDALHAWPGMYVPEVEKRPLIPTEPTYRATTIELPAIILPLPQKENNND